MSKMEFKLTPAYCLFNGIAVYEQNGAEITFLIENDDDALLQERLTKAFENYLENIRHDENCPEKYRRMSRIEFIKSSRSELRKCISELYEKDKNEENQYFSDDEEQQGLDDAAAVLLLDSILDKARSKKASDIHIEKNTVRYRINGKLENQSELIHEKATELVQRIKLLAGMNVLEKRKSQDGHFVYGDVNPLFVRVSSMSIFSKQQSEMEESVVLRILDTSRIPLSLSQLGFDLLQFESIKRLCQEKNGLIVICGPTGAGKSTTAASMLLEIKKQKNDTLKIISLEDPPEYIIPGITQVQIDDSQNNTYEDALAHVFRQDPDVIMIGEIRDEKSATAAIRASLTGHLVLATLHTSSAAGSVLRLENLGIGRKIIASVLKGVVVQDLSFSEDSASLIADVALPDYSFAADISTQMSEDEIERLFDHLTNYSDVISQTFANRTRKKIVPVSSGTKQKSIQKEA